MYSPTLSYAVGLAEYRLRRRIDISDDFFASILKRYSALSQIVHPIEQRVTTARNLCESSERVHTVLGIFARVNDYEFRILEHTVRSRSPYIHQQSSLPVQPTTPSPATSNTQHIKRTRGTELVEPGFVGRLVKNKCPLILLLHFSLQLS